MRRQADKTDQLAPHLLGIRRQGQGQLAARPLHGHLKRLLGRLLHLVDKLGPLGDLLLPYPLDAIARLNAGLLAGARGHHSLDHRQHLATERHYAQAADGRLLVGVKLPAGQLQGLVHRVAGVGRLELELDRVIAKVADEGIGHALPVTGLLAADTDNFHAGFHPGRRHDGGGTHLAHHGFDGGHADHEHQPEGEQGKHEVGHGAGCHDGHPRPDALVIESELLVTGFELVHPAVQHLDVTAEGDQGQHVLGAILAQPTPDGLAETDGETFDLDAATTGHPEVAEFMYRNQQPEGDDKGTDVPQHTAHQPITSLSCMVLSPTIRVKAAQCHETALIS